MDHGKPTAKDLSSHSPALWEHLSSANLGAFQGLIKAAIPLQGRLRSFGKKATYFFTHCKYIFVHNYSFFGYFFAEVSQFLVVLNLFCCIPPSFFLSLFFFFLFLLSVISNRCQPISGFYTAPSSFYLPGSHTVTHNK